MQVLILSAVAALAVAGGNDHYGAGAGGHFYGAYAGTGSPYTSYGYATRGYAAPYGYAPVPYNAYYNVRGPSRNNQWRGIPGTHKLNGEVGTGKYAITGQWGLTDYVADKHGSHSDKTTDLKRNIRFFSNEYDHRYAAGLGYHNRFHPGYAHGYGFNFVAGPAAVKVQKEVTVKQYPARAHAGYANAGYTNNGAFGYGHH